MPAVRFARLALIAAALAACAGPTRSGVAPSAAGGVRGRIRGGGAVILTLDGPRIARITPTAARADDGWLVAGLIDGHVHLAFWPVAAASARHGLAAAVDLGAPGDAMAALEAGLLPLIVAGPMLTRPGGYPLDAWGRDGFGVACPDVETVDAAIEVVARRGARIIKLAIGDDGLAAALVPVAVAAAHARGLKVAAHALTDHDARQAADAGVDLLAHTPVEPLRAETLAAWRGRAVVSTLAAFGGGPAVIDNLRRLRAAGVTVLYGTDLGNTRVDGPNRDEIALLGAAGLDGAAIVDAMTAAPAAWFGFADLGAIAVGRTASFEIVDEDPDQHPAALAAPRAVYLRGARIDGR